MDVVTSTCNLQHASWRQFNGNRTTEIIPIKTQLKPWIELGLSGAVYTQTTDVEIEINGYLTYDREVLKMDASKLKQAHAKLYKMADK